MLLLGLNTLGLRRTIAFFDGFERKSEFAISGMRKLCKRNWPKGCIPECFVGHYRVKYDTGLNYPVNSWDALTAAPFRSAPPHRAEKTWPRFFIVVQISSRDSVFFQPYFWLDWRSWPSSRWRARLI